MVPDRSFSASSLMLASMIEAQALSVSQHQQARHELHVIENLNVELEELLVQDGGSKRRQLAFRLVLDLGALEVDVELICLRFWLCLAVHYCPLS